MPCLYVFAAVVIQNQYFTYDINTVWVAGIARLGFYKRISKARNMIEAVIVATIGALGVVIAAWIGARIRGRKKGKGEQVQYNVVGRDKISGDVVGRDKIEAHDHIHIEDSEAEKKNAFVYFLEKLFAFVFTFAIAGLIFGGIGFVVGQEAGGVIGLVLAFIASIVSAGNVKRTKGII